MAQRPHAPGGSGWLVLTLLAVLLSSALGERTYSQAVVEGLQGELQAQKVANDVIRLELESVYKTVEATKAECSQTAVLLRKEQEKHARTNGSSPPSTAAPKAGPSTNASGQVAAGPSVAPPSLVRCQHGH
eukprot:CAMPEP_0114257056 /NCGR_PEP_ID=MMETSP0058-20121206/18511_1 /TAXON_ID=36894 /ORGANISM="Pyramimonas parkeae, CCMP726" /LENGTH=130 /DNA_ID=CAMNT_0001371721 /DNA_START=203 /DNA_END=596 /DNA_ORIENTATION=+